MISMFWKRARSVRSLSPEMIQSQLPETAVAINVIISGVAGDSSLKRRDVNHFSTGH